MCRTDWMEIRETTALKCHRPFFSVTRRIRFLTECDERWTLLRESATISAVVGLRWDAKTLPAAETTLKEGYGDCLVVSNRLIYHSSLNLGETITPEKYCQWIDKIYQKLRRNAQDGQYRNQFSSTTTPDHTSHIDPPEAARIVLQSSASSVILAWPLAYRLPLFQASGRMSSKKYFRNQDNAKNAFNAFAATGSVQT